MAEIEEIKVENENAKTEEIRINNRVTLTKVFFGTGDDFVVISGNDMSIVRRFLDARNKFASLADDLEAKETEIMEKYKGEEDGEISASDEDELYELYKTFADGAAKIIDGVFGEGKTRSFFGDVYEAIPDYIPSKESFEDFFDSLGPVINRLSEHKVKLEKLASEQRMAKYQPQDHKKPQRKGTK